ncbi:MAG: alginate O-acetyltransferase [Bacteroidia bacterium]|nr:MAG: alginate O-acetyltransferase [Bacteroidia bacterium]
MDLWKFFTYSTEYLPTFTSGIFAFFFVIFYLIWSISQQKIAIRNAVLLVFSLYIYYKLANEYVIVLIFYALIDYFIGLQIYKEKKESLKKLLLYTSVLLNLSILFFFKYLGFAFQTWNVWTGQEIFIPQIIAPLGISFWIFRSLSYVLDVYNEIIDKPTTNYFHYLLYLSYFPTILAGPIARAEPFLEQIKKNTQIDDRTMSLGYWLIITGLIKKIVLSDPLGANFVQRIFENPGFYTGLESLLAAFTYGFYLYYDFSGYTDMAIGMSLLIGIQIPQNFHEPFKAQSITEFWRRWHITLFQWFNDYVFTPLNFSLRRWGKSAAIFSMMITFLLSGIWHGANFTFIVWGLLHGIAISYEIATQEFRKRLKNLWGNPFHTVFSIGITYTFLTFTFFFFNAPSLESTFKMFDRILNDFHIELFPKWYKEYQLVAHVLLAGIILHYLPTSWKKFFENQFLFLHWTLKIWLIVIAVILVYQFKTLGSIPFVYLQF